MSFRVGQGYDIHRLAAGRRLVLGGVEIESPVGAVGHSDADVLLHAVTDAVLGAVGAGDIGELFPDDDPANRDRDSADFLREALRRAGEAGREIINLDATVICETPRLSPYKRVIRDNLAALCGCPAARVNVKAKTNEKLDAVGAAAAVAAQAVALLGPREE